MSQYFFPEQFSNNEIVKRLTNSGHSVDVFCSVPNYPAGKFFDGYSNRKKRREVWNGARINRVLTIPRGRRAIQLVANYLCYPVTGIWTVITQKSKSPDVIFVSMPSPVFQALLGIVAKAFFGGKLVYWVQDIWPESAILSYKVKSPIIIKPLTGLTGWIYRRADLVLVQSEAFPDMIERFGIAKDKIDVFPNTAPDYYRPSKPTKDTDIAGMIPKDGFRLMFAGNIGESQDFDTYIEAAKLLRNRAELQWVIVGSGRELENVRAKVKSADLEDAFHFLGRHPETDMPEFFAHADAMLVGLKDNPIFRLTVPYKVQCYMACGRPIIGSLNGEGARIIGLANAGLVAPAESPSLLAAKIEEMLDMPKDKVKKLGAAGRTYFEDNYASEIVYSRLETWLEDVSADHK